jgi:hypothetical protein
MRKPLSSFPYVQNLAPGAGSTPTAQDVSHFLRRHERMASLIPSAQRLISLQKECANILPAMFRECAVVRFEAGELLMSVPHTALATRLKQQLPQLRAALLKRGWQVSAIQMKVQVKSTTIERVHCKEVFLPETALDSLASLHQNLEDTPRNAALKAALDAMVKRHRNK